MFFCPELKGIGVKHDMVTLSLSLLLQTIDQFEYDGCDNCESYLQMKGNREMVYECTSSSFDGYATFLFDFFSNKAL